MKDDRLRLTELTKFSGCGAKLGPGLLDKALCELSQPSFPELLVDYRSSDDAGIWRIDENTALVQTVDFFPPVVDDPFDFGRIAAANALSDVYAMGGRPITALSIVAFPAENTDIAVLRSIMEGALDALKESGTALVGGHSIKDDELKFGLAVTGLVHPHRALRNNRPRPGDTIILTKPLGTGCINRALKAGKASEEALGAAIRSMSSLNAASAAVLTDFEASACTDVTGFGLVGHACEMITGSGCGIRFRWNRLPILPGAMEYIRAGLVPGGTGANREHREPWVARPETVGEDRMNLLFDPQTSGGLLASIPADQEDQVMERLEQSGSPGWAVGEVVSGTELIEILD